VLVLLVLRVVLVVRAAAGMRFGASHPGRLHCGWTRA